MTDTPPAPGTASATGAAIQGTDGHLLQIDAALTSSRPGLRITGLPEASAWTTRDRVYAAIMNSGQPWPRTPVAVTFRPARLTSHRAGTDLAIAVAMLTAASTLPSWTAEGVVLAAELGIDGGLRPVRDIAPVIRAASEAGFRQVLVAAGQDTQTGSVAGTAVVSCASLADALSWLTSRPWRAMTGPLARRRSAVAGNVAVADDDERHARAVLSHQTEPSGPLLGALLQVLPPAETLAAIQVGSLPAAAAKGLLPATAAQVRGALGRWRNQLAEVRMESADLRRLAEWGLSLICPGDACWPAQLADLGTGQPVALWVRGHADLAASCGRAIAVAGARAATSYGTHVASQMSAGLSAAGWTIVSGGALRIDAAAHRSALGADGTTIAVLACGPDAPYPWQNRALLGSITERGAVISEWPPGQRPTRQRFLTRNRIIAALGRGTVVVEAAEHSGTMSTARYAEELRRPLMAVPGPVTSAMSVGCHALTQAGRAACVTSAADVLRCLTPPSGTEPTR
jgi:DNA processing protein